MTAAKKNTLTKNGTAIIKIVITICPAIKKGYDSFSNLIIKDYGILIGILRITKLLF
ncbi:hypothetical protein [Nonlabens sp.]|jgi:hypothetical protein|uniref:hypothetical protein n=1 Tax=Nonlabens sp. TaxID=1888209 RepID=UPI00321E211D